MSGAIEILLFGYSISSLYTFLLHYTFVSLARYWRIYTVSPNSPNFLYKFPHIATNVNGTYLTFYILPPQVTTFVGTTMVTIIGSKYENTYGNNKKKLTATIHIVWRLYQIHHYLLDLPFLHLYRHYQYLVFHLYHQY